MRIIVKKCWYLKIPITKTFIGFHKGITLLILTIPISCTLVASLIFPSWFTITKLSLIIVLFFSYRPKCVHGTCVADKDGPKKGQNNFCICETGWKNDTCSQCVPYWNCPNQSNDACVEPNECICSGDSQGPLCSLNIKGRTKN